MRLPDASDERDHDRVHSAAAELSAEIPDSAVIEPRVLHVRDLLAIHALAVELGEIDILFANATSRMAPDADPADEIEAVADTNNVATVTPFASLHRASGRVAG